MTETHKGELLSHRGILCLWESCLDEDVKGNDILGEEV